MAQSVAAPTTRVTTKAKSSRAYRTQRTLEVWVVRLIVIAVTLATFFPTFYVLLTSFKQGESLLAQSIFPTSYTLDNYLNLFRTGSLQKWILNSLILGLIGATISTVIAALAGFAFSRFQFPGRKYGILMLLLIGMLPATMSIIALFNAYARLGLLNNLIWLAVLFGASGGLAVWLMKNYMDTVPKDLDEAAYVDGATHWQLFTKVVFPLIQPILVAQFILSFIGIYNEYATATIFLSDPNLYPLGVGVRGFLSGYRTNWTAFCAAAVIGSLPIVIMFLFAQRFLVEGMTRGAVKG
jgi:arabinogalactan oligomer / maltooligosaccharide transport system permease protein